METGSLRDIGDVRDVAALIEERAEPVGLARGKMSGATSAHAEALDHSRSAHSVAAWPGAAAYCLASHIDKTLRPMTTGSGAGDG